MRRSCRKADGPRRGAVTLEWLMVTPALLIVFFAAFEFGTIQLVQATITHATTYGARQAGKDTAVIDDVVAAVNLILDAIDLEITDVDGSGGVVFFEDGPGMANLYRFGDDDLDCDPPANPVLDTDEVRVTLCIEVSATPVIDVSDCYGITLSGKRFYVSSLVKKEEGCGNANP